MASPTPSDAGRHAEQPGDLVRQVELWLLKSMSESLGESLGQPDGADWEAAALARLRLWRRRAEAGVVGAATQLDAAVADAIANAREESYRLASVDIGEPYRPHRLGERGLTPARGPLGQALVQALSVAPDILSRAYSGALRLAAAETTETSRLAAAQRLLDTTLAAGVGGYTDAGGRRWHLTSYVEMSVRSEAARVALDTHAAALSRAGLDLVEVSDSPDQCPTCTPWENRILSLSGTGRGLMAVSSETGPGMVVVQVAASLAEARAAGLFHPNCSHSYSGFVAGATQLRLPLDAEQAERDQVRYRATQRQRAMERHVREWKRREALALDPAAADRATRKRREWQRALAAHVEAHDLKRLRRRESVGKAL